MSELTPQIRKAIDQLLTKYPASQRQSAVISALMLVQQQNNGWLTVADMDLVAEYLGMPKIAVYEVASFYSMFELKPVGKYKISICTNVSCMLRGCETIVAHLEKKLNIKLNETTPDLKFTLKEVECMAACGGAPMFQIGEQYYENLTPDKVDQILAELQ